MFFFFFKQKTAYELRISDWSSDVCSSDLCRRPAGGPGELRHVPQAGGGETEPEAAAEGKTGADAQAKGDAWPGGKILSPLRHPRPARPALLHRLRLPLAGPITMSPARMRFRGAAEPPPEGRRSPWQTGWRKPPWPNPRNISPTGCATRTRWNCSRRP